MALSLPLLLPLVPVLLGCALRLGTPRRIRRGAWLPAAVLAAGSGVALALGSMARQVTHREEATINAALRTGNTNALSEGTPRRRTPGGRSLDEDAADGLVELAAAPERPVRVSQVEVQHRAVAVAQQEVVAGAAAAPVLRQRPAERVCLRRERLVRARQRTGRRAPRERFFRVPRACRATRGGRVLPESTRRG